MSQALFSCFAFAAISLSEAQWFVNSEGAVWELIRRTEAHHEYKHRYSLRSGEEGWVSLRQPLPTGSDGGDAEPQLVGLDCEMGQTTGAPNPIALALLAAFDKA